MVEKTRRPLYFDFRLLAYALIESFRYPVQGDAVVSLNNEFLLEPQLFLEVLNLGKKIDNAASDLAQTLNFLEVSFSATK